MSQSLWEKQWNTREPQLCELKHFDAHLRAKLDYMQIACQAVPVSDFIDLIVSIWCPAWIRSSDWWVGSLNCSSCPSFKNVSHSSCRHWIKNPGLASFAFALATTVSDCDSSLQSLPFLSRDKRMMCPKLVNFHSWRSTWTWGSPYLVQHLNHH